MKHLVTTAVLVLGAAMPCSANDIQNGLFDDGLIGWSALAETNFSGPVPSGNYVNVQQNSGNPFARLISDPDAASFVTFISLTQAFQVTSGAPVLSFDLGLVTDVENSVNPPLPSERSASVDNFRAIITDLDAVGNIFDPGRYILVDRTSTSGHGNPSQRTVTDNAFPSASGTGVSLELTTQAAGNPFFDTTVSVDLTNLIGRDLSLQFVLRDFFDGRQTAYAVDNIMLSPTATGTPGPAVIPLPASMWLLAPGIGALVGFRRRRAS